MFYVVHVYDKMFPVKCLSFCSLLNVLVYGKMFLEVSYFVEVYVLLMFFFILQAA